MRREDWPQALATAIKEANAKQFAWGEHDCLLFASDCIKAMTGDDPAKGIRGKYESEIGALRLMVQRDYVSVDDAVDDYYRRVPLPMAKRGDLLLWQKALGVCMGEHGAFLSRDGGITYAPTLDCEVAWSVE